MMDCCRMVLLIGRRRWGKKRMIHQIGWLGLNQRKMNPYYHSLSPSYEKNLLLKSIQAFSESLQLQAIFGAVFVAEEAVLVASFTTALQECLRIEYWEGMVGQYWMAWRRIRHLKVTMRVRVEAAGLQYFLEGFLQQELRWPLIFQSGSYQKYSSNSCHKMQAVSDQQQPEIPVCLGMNSGRMHPCINRWR